MDEMRHTQLNLMVRARARGQGHPVRLGAEGVPHEQLGDHRRLARSSTTSMTCTSAVDVALGLPFTFETGFTNLQFVALASSALEAGDINFANMISSIQTDEARHAQQGGPTLEILLEQDPEHAQWIIDTTRSGSPAGLFAIVTGPSMDYYTPLEGRGAVLQGVHGGVDRRPVHDLLRGLRAEASRGTGTSSSTGSTTRTTRGHLGTWFYRWTLFWNPRRRCRQGRAGVADARSTRTGRRTGAPCGTQVIHNVNDGRPDLTLPATLPWSATCASSRWACDLAGVDEVPGASRYKLVHNGYKYWFCSEPCRQHLVGGPQHDDPPADDHRQRLLEGRFEPAGPHRACSTTWVVSDKEMGDDACGMSWAFDYAEEYAATQSG